MYTTKTPRLKSAIGHAQLKHKDQILVSVIHDQNTRIKILY